MVVQHQERACQYKFLPKPFEPEKPVSVLRCNRLRWFGHDIFAFAVITLLNAFAHV